MKDDKFRIKLFSGFFPWCLFSLITTVFIFIHSCTNKENQPAEDYLQALVKFEPWAESVWKEYNKIPGSGYFGDGQTEGNGGIRGTCGIALSYVVLIQEFPDSPERVHRLKRVEEALRYAIETHSSGVTNSIITGWVNIDNWLGLITDYEERFIYRAALDYNRRGAAEDALIYLLDEKVKQRMIIILPGYNAAKTRSAQRTLRWENSSIMCNLSFRMPQGNIKEIDIPSDEKKSKVVQN
jgi:hypothetical protein